MEDQQAFNEISLKEIFEKLWLNKYLILIITLSIAILMTLSLYLVFKPKQVATVDFEYYFLNIESDEYPDQSIFDYRDMISYENLKEIKSSKTIYENIDVEAISIDSKTRVSRQEAISSSDSDIIYSDYGFSLTIPLKYFDYDHDLAVKFLSDIIASVYDEAILKNETLVIYDYLSLISDDVEYSEQIDYYYNQYQLLLSHINTFIDQYGDITFNDIRILDLREQLVKAYQTYPSIDEVKQSIIDNVYYKNATSYINQLEIKIAYIQNDIRLNELKILELETMYDELVATSNLQQADLLLSEIASYRIENVEYTYQVNQYQSIIDTINQTGLSSNDASDFVDTLIFIDQYLTDFTQDYNTFYIDYMHEQTRIVYENGSVIEVDGGQSPLVLTAISIIVGGLSACVVIFIKESK